MLQLVAPHTYSGTKRLFAKIWHNLAIWKWLPPTPIPNILEVWKSGNLEIWRRCLLDLATIWQQKSGKTTSGTIWEATHYSPKLSKRSLSSTKPKRKTINVPIVRKTSFYAHGQICPFGLSLSPFFQAKKICPYFFISLSLFGKGSFALVFWCTWFCPSTKLLCHTHFRRVVTVLSLQYSWLRNHTPSTVKAGV